MSKMRTQCEDASAKCEDASAKCEDAYPKGTLIYAARLAFLGHDSCICYGISRKLFTSILHRLPIDLTSTSPWPYIHLTFTSRRLFRDKLVYGQVVWLTYWVLPGHNAKNAKQNAKNAKQNANSMRRRMSKMRRRMSKMRRKMRRRMSKMRSKMQRRIPQGNLIYASKTVS
jgi:hypothetical protein